MDPYEPPPPGRETMLTVILTGMVLVFSLFVLIIITGGWVMYLALVVAALAWLFLFHYFTWGKPLSDEMKGEREEEQLRQRIKTTDTDDWHPPDTRVRKEP